MLDIAASTLSICSCKCLRRLTPSIKVSSIVSPPEAQSVISITRWIKAKNTHILCVIHWLSFRSLHGTTYRKECFVIDDATRTLLISDPNCLSLRRVYGNTLSAECRCRFIAHSFQWSICYRQRNSKSHETFFHEDLSLFDPLWMMPMKTQLCSILRCLCFLC